MSLRWLACEATHKIREANAVFLSRFLKSKPKCWDANFFIVKMDWTGAWSPARTEWANATSCCESMVAVRRVVRPCTTHYIA